MTQLFSKLAKHSILIATYNQENLITDCLESVLVQKDYIYEIIINDDCSTDNTWDIVKKYASLYPKLIKIHRSEANIGVFNSLNWLMKQASGDIINIVAGDDLLPENILKTYTEFIFYNKLNCNDKFIIYTDAVAFDKQGNTKLYRNERVTVETPLDLILKCELYFWETGLSYGLIKSAPLYNSNIGYQADWLYHVERALCCDNHYYIPIVGYKYRVGVGVTAKSKLTELYKSRYRVLKRIKTLNLNAASEKSILFLNTIDAMLKYFFNPNLKTYTNFLFKRIKLGRVVETNELHNWKIYIPLGIKDIIKKVLLKA